MDFPVLDFQEFVMGDEEHMNKFAAAIVNSFELYGFVKVINHGLSTPKIEQAFAWSRRFFALPLETKMKSKHPPKSNPHRGYSYVGQENLSALTRADRNSPRLYDLKESWDQGATDDLENPNLWPEYSDIPGFQEFMEVFFHECHETEVALLEAVAMGLGLSRNHFDSMHTDRVNEFRLLHYPEVEVKELQSGINTRASEHTDFGTITLLFQDSVGGLEVEDQSQMGVFRPVEAVAPIMVVNIGDCMQRWTNNRLKSACHRVTIPPRCSDGCDVIDERYSIAFFGKPNRNAELYPHPLFISIDNPSKYEHTTAGEYNQTRLVKVY